MKWILRFCFEFSRPCIPFAGLSPGITGSCLTSGDQRQQGKATKFHRVLPLSHSKNAGLSNNPIPLILNSPIPWSQIRDFIPAPGLKSTRLNLTLRPGRDFQATYGHLNDWLKIKIKIFDVLVSEKNGGCPKLIMTYWWINHQHVKGWERSICSLHATRPSTYLQVPPGTHLFDPSWWILGGYRYFIIAINHGKS